MKKMRIHTKLLETALWYASVKKFSVIPVRRDKKPYIKWERFQKERPPEKQVKDWWEKYPEAMIGIITGKISDLAVIDIDTDEGFDEIDKIIPRSLYTRTVNTPKGGQHLYFRCPDEIISNNARTIPGCDFRAEGGYVVAPPSINADNKIYHWAEGLSLAEVDSPALPDSYIKVITNNKIRKEPQKDNSTLKMFEHGRRDNDLFYTAYSLVKGGMPREKIFQVLQKITLSWGEDDPNWINTKIESALKREQKIVKEREVNNVKTKKAGIKL